jgi:hypothetical protein
MAKETFQRSKPHVNIGTLDYTLTLDGASGLTVLDTGTDVDGNPGPSMVLTFGAPTPLAPESVAIAFPIDDVFFFDPATSGPAVSIDFLIDVLPSTVVGTADVDVTLAIIQDEPFIVERAGGPSVDGSESGWTTLGQNGLRSEDFVAVDGGPERPDFGRPFQFGYAFSGEFSTTALSVELGLDNMEVEITTVPELSSFILAVAMGATLCWHRFRSGNEGAED